MTNMRYGSGVYCVFKGRSTRKSFSMLNIRTIKWDASNNIDSPQSPESWASSAMQVLLAIINPHYSLRTMKLFVGLRDELNAALETSIQIFYHRSMLWKILANIFLFQIWNSQWTAAAIKLSFSTFFENSA